MRKLILGCGILLLMSFGVQRYYQFRMTESQANFHWQNLENLKLMLDNSNLPHSQVKMALLSLDSLQKDMQLGLSIDSIGTLKSK
jgi:hypothetical protein